MPDRVRAALDGNREALIDLLLIAADVAWQTRAEILGTVQEVAGATHRFADEVADCYSAGQPPSDRMCDAGFALADRVDALAVEVLHRRAQAGMADDAALPHPPRSPTRDARHLARAHLAALRDAAEAEQAVTDFAVQAAAHLYQAIVTLGRERTGQDARNALMDDSRSSTTPSPSDEG
ncbi:MAG TPA: hypothetical protein VNA11_11440 [Pseudonocardia sp.]|nr:hypothetical protein [Pseudonocardia sp.]